MEKVVGESEHAETLFRANTAATKLIGAFTRLVCYLYLENLKFNYVLLAQHGREYLRQFIEPLIEKIEKDGLEYEVNPTLASGGDVEANARAFSLRTFFHLFFRIEFLNVNYNV